MCTSITPQQNIKLTDHHAAVRINDNSVAQTSSVYPKHNAPVNPRQPADISPVDNNLQLLRWEEAQTYESQNGLQTSSLAPIRMQSRPAFRMNEIQKQSINTKINESIRAWIMPRAHLNVIFPNQLIVSNDSGSSEGLKWSDTTHIARRSPHPTFSKF